MVTQRDPAVNADVAKFLGSLPWFVDAPILDERRYLECGLDFANADEASSLVSMENALMSGLEPEPLAQIESLIAPRAEKLRTLRDQFRARLEQIRRGSQKDRLALGVTVGIEASQMVIRPTYGVRESSVEVRYRHYPVNLLAALAYVLLLLLDDSRRYGKDLCQCRLKTCQRYFFAIKPPTGRPRRDYCCQAHLDAARAATGTRRVQNYRKRQKAKRTNKRSRP